MHRSTPAKERRKKEELNKKDTYIWGDVGAVEMGVSVNAAPTPSLDTLRLPLPAGYLGGGISESFSKSLACVPLLAPAPLAPLEATLLGLSVAALVMMADRAISECCAIPALQAGTHQRSRGEEEKMKEIQREPVQQDGAEHTDEDSRSAVNSQLKEVESLRGRKWERKKKGPNCGGE